jgi:hypothetical protein
MITHPSSPEPADALLALCDQLLDGELPLEGRAQLEATVFGDAGWRRLYVEYMQLNASLRQQCPSL